MLNDEMSWFSNEGQIVMKYSKFPVVLLYPSLIFHSKDTDDVDISLDKK